MAQETRWRRRPQPRADPHVILHSSRVQSVSEIAISEEKFRVARQIRLHPAELVLDSENAIGEKSSRTLCGSMRKRPDGFVSSMQSP